MYIRKHLCELYIGLHIISAVLTGPHNTAVAVGSAATFTCTTDDSEPCFRWNYKAAHVEEYKRLYESSGLAPDCKCNVTYSDNKRTSSLTINDVQLTDVGLYKCAECWTTNSSEAGLSIVGKKQIVRRRIT